MKKIFAFILLAITFSIANGQRPDSLGGNVIWNEIHKILTDQGQTSGSIIVNHSEISWKPNCLMIKDVVYDIATGISTKNGRLVLTDVGDLLDVLKALEWEVKPLVDHEPVFSLDTANESINDTMCVVIIMSNIYFIQNSPHFAVGAVWSDGRINFSGMPNGIDWKFSERQIEKKAEAIISNAHRLMASRKFTRRNASELFSGLMKSASDVFRDSESILYTENYEGTCKNWMNDVHQILVTSVDPIGGEMTTKNKVSWDQKTITIDSITFDVEKKLITKNGKEIFAENEFYECRMALYPIWGWFYENVRKIETVYHDDGPLSKSFIQRYEDMVTSEVAVLKTQDCLYYIYRLSGEILGTIKLKDKTIDFSGISNVKNWRQLSVKHKRQIISFVSQIENLTRAKSLEIYQEIISWK